MKLTNANLIAALKSGKATEAHRVEYQDRKIRLNDAPPCEYGHFDCALVEGGPCSNEHAPED